MRQAGVLAAAGLVALEDSPALLLADHAHARLLAERLARISGIVLDLSRIQTNIVIFDVSALGVTARELSNDLKSHGVLANGINATHMRMVTHRDVTEAECLRAAETLAQAVAQKSFAGAAV